MAVLILDQGGDKFVDTITVTGTNAGANIGGRFIENTDAKQVTMITQHF